MPYLNNHTQEKLLIYRVPIGQYNVIDFNTNIYHTYVWAPYLPDFLKTNTDNMVAQPFQRGWYGLDKILSAPVGVDLSPVSLFRQNQETLMYLPLFSDIGIQPDYNDPMNFYVGRDITKVNGYNVVVTPQNTQHFLDQTSIVFSPNGKLIYPNDPQTQGFENLLLQYQQDLLTTDLKAVSVNKKLPFDFSKTIFN